MNFAVAKHSSLHLFSSSSSGGTTNTNSSASTSLSVTIPKRALRTESKNSGDGVASPKQRNNLFKDVVLRVEVSSETLARNLAMVMYFSVALGVMLLICLAVLKLASVFEDESAQRTYNQVNVVVAFASTVAMSVSTGCYLHRVGDVTRRGFRWSFRRRRQMWLNAGQLVSHTVNSLFYLLPNLMVLHRANFVDTPLFKYLGVIQFTMWNNIFLIFLLKSRSFNLWMDKEGNPIGRKDAILLDAPLSMHWWIFLIWAAFEGFLVVGTIVLEFIEEDINRDFDETLCNIPKSVLYLIGTLNIIMLGYHLLGLGYIYRAYRQLLRKPYNLFRGTNLGLRHHLMMAATVGDLVTLAFVLLFWVKYNSCSTGVLTWFGILPCQLVMTVCSVVMCILVMPAKPGRKVTLDITPNLLVWREAQVEAQQKGFEMEGGDEEPCLHPYCFEMSVKLWYWSLAVYGYDPVTERCFDPKYPQMSFKVAMLMYDLQHFEFIQEEICDTNVLVAWNDNTILVCFRGTYSASNVWTDLQFWRVVHTPKRGNYFMRSQPLVHKGFMKSWTASNLNHKILNRVIRIVHSGKFDKANARVLVTGHSLGGALAVLASYDIVTHCGIGGDQITCYTYGAPRVGNHAFARQYDALVPNTWQVINDEDLVPRMPKFLVLFKHVGRKVIINSAGDLIVKPHLVEVSMYRMFSYFKKSLPVAQHLLLSYRKSFVAICEAQFIQGKALTGGMEAMLLLLEERDRLLSEGLDVKMAELHQLHSLGSSIWTKSCKLRRRHQCKVHRMKNMLSRWSWMNSSAKAEQMTDESSATDTHTDEESFEKDSTESENKGTWEI